MTLSPLSRPLGAPPVLSSATATPPAATPAPPAAAPVDGVAPPSEPPPPPPPTAAEILASARAASLEANKTWLKGWQEHNPWDTKFPPPKPPKKQGLVLWAAPKPLSSRQRATLKKLTSAGFSPAYARQLVERGDSNWIAIMARNPVKRKRK